MEGPVIAIAGQALKFGTDGNVADKATGNVIGAWTSVSDPGDNKIRYKIGAADQAPLTAKYSFGSDLDNSNQLQVQLATADGAATSDTFAFVGGIEVDEDHKLNYFLVDNTGARTGVSLTLYGDLSFSQANNNLVITLIGGGTAEVQGLGGDGFLKATEKDLAKFKGDDLLEFAAQTTNTIPGADALVVDAVIKFYGNWDIKNGSLIFMSNIQTSAAGSQIELGFAGKLKGVALGFAYFSGEGNTQFAFNITGKHVFKSGADLSWTSSIGFTGKSFDATVEVTADIPVGKNKLSLNGSLKLKNADGTSHPALDLSLEAEYKFDEHNVLKFMAVVSDGPTPSYDLQLTGTFQYSDLSLTFSVDFNDKAGKEIKVSLGIQGDEHSIIKFLKLAFDYTDAQANAQLSLSFSARVEFVDGVKKLVTKPTPPVVGAGDAAAGAGTAGALAAGGAASGAGAEGSGTAAADDNDDD